MLWIKLRAGVSSSYGSGPGSTKLQCVSDFATLSISFENNGILLKGCPCPWMKN
jgi:hypothetical protein